jgi:N-acetylglucosaminyldiphosphoundecaprenol N-acetyl-beta-D-mannosaminyltransferase
MKQEILGVKIDQVYLGDVLNSVSDFIKSDNQHYIVTINPEFIVESQNNKQFKDVLNNADVATCDGIGLYLASGFKLKRVTGVELSQELLKTDWLKIFLLGGDEDSAKKVAKDNPQTVVGSERGGAINKKKWTLDDNDEVIKKINKSGANVLLVGFGQVKQEMWIYRNLSKVPNIKIAVGIGGTFDYLSGNVKRAPKWMRELGLEWFYRLITQPSRIGRIFNATFKFLWLVIVSKRNI